MKSPTRYSVMATVVARMRKGRGLALVLLVSRAAPPEANLLSAALAKLVGRE